MDLAFTLAVAMALVRVALSPVVKVWRFFVRLSRMDLDLALARVALSPVVQFWISVFVVSVAFFATLKILLHFSRIHGLRWIWRHRRSCLGILYAICVVAAAIFGTGEEHKWKIEATLVLSIIAFLAFIIRTIQEVVDSNLTLKGFFRTECRFFLMRQLCELLIPLVYFALVYVGSRHLEATDDDHQHVKEKMAALTYFLTLAILVCGGYSAALDASEFILSRLKVNNGNDDVDRGVERVDLRDPIPESVSVENDDLPEGHQRR